MLNLQKRLNMALYAVQCNIRAIFGVIFILLCYNAEGYSKSTDRDKCQEWGRCDQLCENTESSYNCSCYPGFDLVDNKSCIADKISAPYSIYFAYDKSILQVDKNGQTQEVVANGSSISDLDYHYDKNLLFWIDGKTKKVHYQYSGGQSKIGMQMANSSKGEFMLLGSPSPVALAVDWIGNKLYIVDSLGEKIDIFELDGRYHAIVMGSNLTEPNDVALDPLAGLMFVADSKQILRAHMDGTNVKSIVSKAIGKASSIVIDSFGERVFWYDSILKQIETVDYMGNNRFVVLKGGELVPSPVKLAVFENRIFWSDGMRRGIMSVNKYEGSSSIQAVFTSTEFEEFKAVKVIHSLLQKQGKNPCGANNGGCHHMCVVTKVTESEFLGYRCACNIGWTLSDDLKTCIVVNEFLLYSQQRCIKGRVLNHTSEGFSEAILPIVPGRGRFVGLSFDFQDGYIYYSDVLRDIIYRGHKNGTENEIVLASQNEGVEGLALDWMTKNLYYVDGRKNTLNVLSTGNFTNQKVLLKNLRRPRGIVVHPNRGYVFFSEWDQPANISRIYTDGTNLTVFRNLILGWPNGLALDFAMERLYWCDASLVHVQHSNLDGMDVKTITSELIKNPYSIAIHQDWMYITDWKLHSILKLHKLNGDTKEVIIKEPLDNRLYGVKIFSQTEQYIDKTHPCLPINNNRGCEKLCFGIPSNTSSTLLMKCGCPDGEKLADDERKCIPDPSAEPPMTQCPNKWDFMCNNQRCIPKTWICDGDDDCLDNSDEKQNYCSIYLKPTCTANEFDCGAGRCIPMTFKCDGENDCGDNSDEKGCVKV